MLLQPGRDVYTVLANPDVVAAFEGIGLWIIWCVTLLSWACHQSFCYLKMDLGAIKVAKLVSLHFPLP